MIITNEFSRQWRNPKDILSLLLLVGGDIVQKAIAQLFGVFIYPSKRLPRIYLTPVAFSFGWIAYAFISLASVVSDKQLMPSTPDSSSMVINCRTGYARSSQSWLLGRIIRDHELKVEAQSDEQTLKLPNAEYLRDVGLAYHDPLHVSLRIDIFELKRGGDFRPQIDHVWIMGWLTIAVQLGVSAIPWGLNGNWAIFVITISGTLFALLTGSLRQWNLEKWPGRQLNKTISSDSGNGKRKMPSTHSPTAPTGSDVEKANASPSRAELPRVHEASRCTCRNPVPKETKMKTVCLTKGNGHRHVMAIVGSETAWDLESLATATSNSLPETPWCLGALAIAWVCLLVSVSGIESDTWFLILVGGLGMVQNIYASSASRSPQSMGLALEKFEQRPTIIGTSTCETRFWPQEVAQAMADIDAKDPFVSRFLDPVETVGVRGAIRELEKTIPGAGFALMPVFFPALNPIDRERYRDDKEARFWEWMLHHPSSEQRHI
ncbi:hypothetical protein ABW21_db0200094 [Orbilia brochopaga]|nr:hypothetical protein ABW21_db0200094 [Drechslerella brochopaga]